MSKISFIILLIFVPGIVCGSTAGDFIVNPQSTYAVPPGTDKVLILDLTLPGIGLTSIKINNTGTIQKYNVSQLLVFEDGTSPGWDGDESERVRKSSFPFFDTEITGDFSKQRIFITLNITSTTHSGRTIKPELDVNSVLFSDPTLNGPSDIKVVGFERTVSVEASGPQVPVSPLAKKGEAISTSTIRWHFNDLSNNEFGFKILDADSNEIVRKEKSDISYIDEIGLQPNTEYSGRRVVAFNDRGESLNSSITVFQAVNTLTEKIEEEATGKEVFEEKIEAVKEAKEEITEELSLLKIIQQKIAELQQQIDELFDRLTEFLEYQGATTWTAFQRFFQSLFGK